MDINMDSLDFFDIFYKIEDEETKRSTDHLYGLACGFRALKTGDFSILAKAKVSDEDDFLNLVDGVIEAIVLMNGNGDMAKAVSMMVNEILAHSTFCISIDKLIQRLDSCNISHLLNDHFDAFFIFYKELLTYRDKEANKSISIEYAVRMFIGHDKNFEKVSLFDETLMPLILEFKDDFMFRLEKEYFDCLFLTYTRPTVKYMVHIAKHLDRSDKKRIMAYLNKIDGAQGFIRVRGARRLFKQIFGSKVSDFGIYKRQPWGMLNEKHKRFFERPCKMIGRYKNEVILEISNRQYLLSMDEKKRMILYSAIEKKVNPNETNAYFANDII